MNILNFAFWIIVGALVAFILLKSQRWTAMVIHPANPRGSKWLVIGGAIIRWILVTLMFVTAITHSTIALFTSFASFLVARLLILAKWQKSFGTDQGHAH
jgi:hypothetical protein